MTSDNPNPAPTIPGVIASLKAVLVAALANVRLLDILVKWIPALAPVAAAEKKEHGNDHNDPRP